MTDQLIFQSNEEEGRFLFLTPIPDGLTVIDTVPYRDDTYWMKRYRTVCTRDGVDVVERQRFPVNGYEPERRFTQRGDVFLCHVTTRRGSETHSIMLGAPDDDVRYTITADRVNTPPRVEIYRPVSVLTR